MSSLLSSQSLFECEYEDIIKANSKLIYPDFYFVQFKKRVNDEDNCAIPDFALIDKNYKE